VVDLSLVNKYNQAIPRYTSYPTVPFWQDNVDLGNWQTHFAEQFRKNNKEGISIYIHLPFCESLCTFCGCNKKITKNHRVEETYLQAIEKEWNLYRRMMEEAPVIKEIHLGGGTPTFFSPRHLQALIDMITRDAIIHPKHDFSIEGHPNNTTVEHLQALYAAGFRRISYGVQDLNPAVQRVINRIQPFENVRRATDNARAAGFHSINFDLVYGLPLQTPDSMQDTMSKVCTLLPDRIALYSYAHVPWVSKAQRLFSEKDLPSAEEKMKLYTNGKEFLAANGYYDIGMDHFSLPQDELYHAKQSGWLHRNFMGYTAKETGLLLGLGVSAISDIGAAFAQNNKTLHEYYTWVNHGQLPIVKGHFMNDEDIAFGKYIRAIACKGHVQFRAEHRALLEEYCFPKLRDPLADGLVAYNSQELKLTETGHHFIRNICSAFDLYLQRKNLSDNTRLFSKAI